MTKQYKAQFLGRTLEMLKSPAFRELSLTALRVLARIEIEHMQHRGVDNGRLPVTYHDFEEYGIRQRLVGRAIRELVELGFIEVTRKGRGGNREFCRPSLYRLTYVQTTDAGPTDEWRQFDS